MRFLLLACLLLAWPVQAAELKLATWNIGWLTLRPTGDPALPRDVITRQPEDFALLADYARRLEADVVALQEIDGAEAAARVFDPAQYQLVFADERDVQRTGFAVRQGLKITRNPDVEELDLYARARFSLRRGADITIEAGRARLRLLSIHLKGGCRDVPMQEALVECDALMQQSRVLADWAAARRREGVAFAILGDFNRAIAGPHDGMERILGAAAPLTRVTEGFGNPCWAGSRGPQRFIDHIILGGPARQWLVPHSLRVSVYAERDRSYRARLSDHCPVSVLLRLPG